MIKKFKQTYQSVAQVHGLRLFLSIMLILLGNVVFASPNKDYYLDFLSQWHAQVKTQTDLNPEEQQLRADFIFRLKFVIDRKYKDEPFSGFILAQIKDLILTDQMKINVAYSNSTDFLLNIKKLLENPPDLELDSLILIKDYVNYSGIMEPIDPELFNLEQNYTNKMAFVQVQTMNLEQASDYYDIWMEKNEKPPKDYLDLNINLNNEYSSTLYGQEKAIPYF